MDKRKKASPGGGHINNEAPLLNREWYSEELLQEKGLHDKKVIYLTCDDWPEEDFTDKIDFLDSHGIKAIWFCLGEKLEIYRDKALYGEKQGHILANHSYDHPWFSQLSDEEAREQLVKTDRILEEIYLEAGIARPFKAFRFPFYDLGNNRDTFPPDLMDSKVVSFQKLLKDHGYTCPDFKGLTCKEYSDPGFHSTVSVECTLDFDDWEIDDNPAAWVKVAERVNVAREKVMKAPTAEILLLHTFIPLTRFQQIIEKILLWDVEFRLPG